MNPHSIPQTTVCLRRIKRKTQRGGVSERDGLRGWRARWQAFLRNRSWGNHKNQFNSSLLAHSLKSSAGVDQFNTKPFAALDYPCPAWWGKGWSFLEQCVLSSFITEIKCVKITFYSGVERDGRKAERYFCLFCDSEFLTDIFTLQNNCPLCQYQRWIAFTCKQNPSTYT